MRFLQQITVKKIQLLSRNQITSIAFPLELTIHK